MSIELESPSATLQESWDLSDLYAGFDDPKLAADLDAIGPAARSFREQYSGRLADLAADPAELAGALADYETLETTMARLVAFPGLRFAADTRDADAKAWDDRVREKVTQAANETLFFFLDLQTLPADAFDPLLDATELAAYRHVFERLAESRAHVLSEPVEQALNEASLTGRSAFIKLREQHMGGVSYPAVTLPDGSTASTEAELHALAHHPDPEIRLRGYQAVRETVGEHNELYAFILNTVAQDHKLEADRRGFSSTLAKQLMGDEVPEPVFRSLMDGTRARFDLFQRYYRLKAKLTGQPIRICDLYAPPSLESAGKTSYGDAVEQLQRAIARFDEGYAARAVDFFRDGWVDVALRPGKRGGAFCWPVTGLHPYLLQSYTGDIDAIFTLAHELGHGLHFTYISEAQPPLSSDPPMVLAEIASIFNELLLLDATLADGPDPATERTIIMHQLESMLNLLFRQSTISRLELMIHDEVRRSGGVDAPFVNAAWEGLYRELLGDAVEYLPEHAIDWPRIGHLYFKPFYCYNYTLSFVVALACYTRYQAEGKAFVPRYLELLAAGSSKAPVEALRDVGIDLESPETVAEALLYVEQLIARLEANTE